MKADPFIRDRRGKLPMDKSKNDKVKALLKDVLSQTTFPASPTPSSAVKLQGILQKWTNYAGGYKKRWFVLENGMIKTDNDEHIGTH
jgi:beta-glucosidase/6-phospho-beta-glucosidase/beta-galactosidase